jgi:hypothetical protein
MDFSMHENVYLNYIISFLDNCWKKTPIHINVIHQICFSNQLNTLILWRKVQLRNMDALVHNHTCCILIIGQASILSMILFLFSP